MDKTREPTLEESYELGCLFAGLPYAPEEGDRAARAERGQTYLSAIEQSLK